MQPLKSTIILAINRATIAIGIPTTPSIRGHHKKSLLANLKRKYTAISTTAV